jgi:hypothetical protein
MQLFEIESNAGCGLTVSAGATCREFLLTFLGLG